MENTHKLYPYGYLISNDKTYIKNNIPNGFNLFEDTYFLAYDPASKLLDFKIDNISVLILGEIYSISEHSDDRNIAKELVTELSKSEKDFFILLKKMWGRFLIIYSNSQNETYCLTDATSMRSLFYTTGGAIACSSHPYILSDKMEPRKFPIKFSYPGNLTPLMGVKILTPNTRLNINDRKITRYYPGLMPTEENRNQSVDSVTENYLKVSKKILKKLIKEENRILISLTGGLDSRITLALILSCIPEYLSKIEFFTYKNNGKRYSSFDPDVIISEMLANKYNLSHTVFDRNEYTNKELKDKVRNTTYITGSVSIISAFEELFGANYTHIRSNVYEIGRTFYLKSTYINNVSKNNYIEKLSDIYINSISQPSNTDIREFYANDRTEVYQTFKEFFEETSFDKAIESIDELDLFYWEHRVGTWLPNIYLETDFVFNTLILPNNWKLLEDFLSIKKEERYDEKVFYEILKRCDQFLIDLPMNPKSLEELKIYDIISCINNDLNGKSKSAIIISIRDILRSLAVEKISFEFIENYINSKIKQFPEYEYKIKKLVFEVLKDDYTQDVMMYAEETIKVDKNPAFIKVMATRYKRIGDLERYDQLMNMLLP